MDSGREFIDGWTALFVLALVLLVMGAGLKPTNGTGGPAEAGVIKAIDDIDAQYSPGCWNRRWVFSSPTCQICGTDRATVNEGFVCSVLVAPRRHQVHRSAVLSAVWTAFSRRYHRGIRMQQLP
jgi:hypothetical protein